MPVAKHYQFIWHCWCLLLLLALCTFAVLACLWTMTTRTVTSLDPVVLTITPRLFSLARQNSCQGYTLSLSLEVFRKHAILLFTHSSTHFSVSPCRVFFSPPLNWLQWPKIVTSPTFYNWTGRSLSSRIACRLASCSPQVSKSLSSDQFRSAGCFSGQQVAL